jgi:hypothetical protein
MRSDKNGDSFMWIRYTSDSDACAAVKQFCGLRMGFVTGELADRFPRVVVAKAVRAEKPERKAIGISGVHELGDLRDSGAESWMLDVAKVHRAKPAVVRSAMAPFQEAAQRGAEQAGLAMAREIPSAHHATKAMAADITRVRTSQGSMLEAIKELSQ